MKATLKDAKRALKGTAPVGWERTDAQRVLAEFQRLRVEQFSNAKEFTRAVKLVYAFVLPYSSDKRRITFGYGAGWPRYAPAVLGTSKPVGRVMGGTARCSVNPLVRKLFRELRGKRIIEVAVHPPRRKERDTSKSA